MTFPPKVWDGVLRRLQNELPSFSYEAWLAPLIALPSEHGLMLTCPTTFHRERVRAKFLPQISRCLAEEMGAETNAAALVELVVATDPARAVDPAPAPKSLPSDEMRATTSPAPFDPPAPSRTAGPTNPPDASASASLAPVRAAVRIRPEARRAPQTGARARALSPYTFDNFVVGPCNALAREAALTIARDQGLALNQLYITAEPGMGKTHLSKAIAAEAERMRGAEVRYTSAEGFTNEFVSALRSRKTEEFKRRYRDRCQILVVEDVQFLESKTATQLEFFHTVQHVLDAGGRVVLTGDRMPQDMPELDSRVRSQLGAGFVAELEPPDAQVRRAILRSMAARGGNRLPHDCLDLLVESVHGSVRELEGVLIQLVTTASLLKRPIDEDLTRTAIAKKVLPKRGPSQLDIGSVIQVVAGFFQTTPELLACRSRKKQVLVPRQLAMYLCRRFTDASVGEIGEALNRDHPSVRNAIKKIERAIMERPPVRYQVEALSDRLDQLRDGLLNR
jgi:chromosomal replication initiator protein